MKNGLSLLEAERGNCDVFFSPLNRICGLSSTPDKSLLIFVGFVGFYRQVGYDNSKIVT